MSAIEIKVSPDDLTYLSGVAQKGHWTLPEAAEHVISQAAKAEREWGRLQRRAERGKGVSDEEFRAILAKVPAVPPISGDELPEGWENKH